MSDNEIDRRFGYAVHWGSNGFDEYGQHTLDEPEEIRVRVEKAKIETLDSKGHKVASDMRLKVGKRIAVGSILWLGQLVDIPDTETDLLQVIEFGQVPDLKARKYDRHIKVIKYSDQIPIVDYSVVHGGVAVVHGGRFQHVTHSV